MKCLKLTSTGGDPKWLIPGEGMAWWQHKPGETRIAFPARDNYVVCSETPDEIAAQLEALGEQQVVQVEGMETRFEALPEALLHFSAERKR